ncbi:MAG: Organic solvent tolerance protein OstA, partial [Bacteroidetes bacterium]|nr:Organic solvent tolerance protein OstA [Bacteroidota bacterium]
MIDSKDTLYLTADTLVSIDSEEDINKRLLAYSNVKIFKTDLKGVCDSISYFVSDSIMFLYGKPALWSGENQMTADTIDMVIRNKSMNKIDLYPDAFVVTLDSAQYFNQIKGRSMEAFFKDDELSKVNVYGNGESIFFMRDEKTRKLIGMNKIICSDIILKFDDRKLTDASFLVKPEGDFIPPHELKESDTKLNGFTWRGGERPKKFELLANELKTQPKLEPQKEIEAVPIKLEKGINPEKRPLKERIKN